MPEIGKFNSLQVIEQRPDGFMLEEGVYLSKPAAPKNLREGDYVNVFVYHGHNDQLNGSVQKPKAQVGDFATLKVVDLTDAGAFLDWGLPKDLFVPRSMHEDDLRVGDLCLVKIIIDPNSGRIMAKEKLEDELSNEHLELKEKDLVNMIVYKDTDLGYQVIINKRHLGLLHYNEVFKDLYAGDELRGFIKKIKEDNKIDVVPGKPGHSRVEDETDKIMNMLKEQGGFLPYHDKTPAEEIYKVFGMSKKTFKMTLGTLYRTKKILITPEGIRES